MAGGSGRTADDQGVVVVIVRIEVGGDIRVTGGSGRTADDEGVCCCCLVRIPVRFFLIAL